MLYQAGIQSENQLIKVRGLGEWIREGGKNGPCTYTLWMRCVADKHDALRLVYPGVGPFWHNPWLT